MRVQRHIEGARNRAGALAAMAFILLALAATAAARPPASAVTQPPAAPHVRTTTPVVAHDNAGGAIVFVLIGVGAGVGVLAAGYLGARRATRAHYHAPPTDVRIG